MNGWIAGAIKHVSSSDLLRALVALLTSALILAPAAAQEHQRAPVPGAVDTHVTQATIHDTICQRGYTAKVRPPRKVTDAIKRRLADGLPASLQDYELDHLIPLGLGGHPTSPAQKMTGDQWLTLMQPVRAPRGTLDVPAIRRPDG